MLTVCSRIIGLNQYNSRLRNPRRNLILRVLQVKLVVFKDLNMVLHITLVGSSPVWRTSKSRILNPRWPQRSKNLQYHLLRLLKRFQFKEKFPRLRARDIVSKLNFKDLRQARAFWL